MASHWLRWASWAHVWLLIGLDGDLEPIVEKITVAGGTSRLTHTTQGWTLYHNELDWMLKWALEVVLEIGKWRQVVKNKNAHTWCCYRLRFVGGESEAWRGAGTCPSRSVVELKWELTSSVATLSSQPISPHHQLLSSCCLLLAPPSFLMCPWSCQVLQDTGQALGLTWRQQELSRGHRPINPVSFRGPFPRQRVTDTILSIFFNANYFFSHVNIKIIVNVLIKAAVISGRRTISSAWERLSGEKRFSEPRWQFRVI